MTRSPFDFIVKPLDGKRHDNTRDIGGGLKLIVNVDEEKAYFTARMGVVVSVPNWYEGDIEEGDILLCHHNVFRKYNDWRGQKRDSRSFINKDLFHVPTDKFYAYKKDGEWKAWDKYCLVEPIRTKGENMLNNKEVELPLIGVVKCSNSELEAQGISDGTKVVFAPDSEYPFNIDGTRIYRMLTEHIAAVL